MLGSLSPLVGLLVFSVRFFFLVDFWLFLLFHPPENGYIKRREGSEVFSWFLKISTFDYFLIYPCSHHAVVNCYVM